jgi:hypothetical protein
MTGNGDLPPKDTGVEVKPDEGKPVEKPAAAAPPPPKKEAQAAPPPPPPPPIGTDINVTGRIEEYEKTVRLNSIVRVAFPLLVLSTIVVFLIVTWLTIWGAFPTKAISHETIRAGEQLMPYFNKIIKSFADDVAPEIMDEFEVKIAEASDKAVSKLSEEIHYLHESNEQFIKDMALIHIKEQKGSHKELLTRLYPELAKDPARLDAMTEKINMAFEYWTVAYMTRVMADYFDTMGQINETVIRSYTAPAMPAGKTKSKVVEAEMLELFMELLNAAYDEGEGAAPEDEAKADVAPVPAEKPAVVEEPAPVEEPEAAPEAGREEAPAEAPAEPAGAPAVNQ